ncbi:hypothetical protein ACLOJK_035377 [Asimina triloba]
MAGNDWINSYLEAILDVGPGIDNAKSKSPSLLLRERGRFNPTRYFVEEVITGFDETDLHRSWVKPLRPVIDCLERLICAPWRWEGGGDEEPAGEEHAAGEHVLEDLESGTEEEAVY